MRQCFSLMSCGGRSQKSLGQCAPRMVSDLDKLLHTTERSAERYNTNTYRRAIHRTVELANRKRKEAGADNMLPKWSPNRLRHSAATEIRRQFGLEAAQVTLGHATADVSQIYAERDLSLAMHIMRKIG